MIEELKEENARLERLVYQLEKEIERLERELENEYARSMWR